MNDRTSGDVHSGSCLCGQVAFTVREFASGIFKCHCSKCRKAFGGASSAAVLAPAAAFSWLRGQQGVLEYREGPGFRRCFCPNCGCILPQYLLDYDLYWIPAGLFDADPGLALSTHIHVRSKAHWEVLDELTPRREEGFDP